MSNTTSIGDRAICEELSCVQLGSASKPVSTAYITNILPVPSGPVPTLQQVCDSGASTTTEIVVESLDVIGANPSGYGMTINGVQCAYIEVDAGSSPNDNIKVATGDIIATAGDFVATAGKAEIESNITSKAGNFTADVGNYVAKEGNYIADKGDFISQEGTIFIQRQIVSNFADGGTSQGFPQLPPFSTPPNMKGKTKGAFWIQNPSASAPFTTQFIVETGITNVALSATVHITMNQYNTANPRRLVNYRIAQLGLASPDDTKLVISFTTDLAIVSTDPVRIGVMIYPDKDPNP